MAAWQLAIGGISYPMRDYRYHVGNIVWDAACVELAEAAKVVNYLRTQHWTCEEAYTPLFEAYRDDWDIAVEDLEKALEPEP
jgi:hypothetical protein